MRELKNLLDELKTIIMELRTNSNNQINKEQPINTDAKINEKSKLTKKNLEIIAHKTTQPHDPKPERSQSLTRSKAYNYENKDTVTDKLETEQESKNQKITNQKVKTNRKTLESKTTKINPKQKKTKKNLNVWT